MRFRKIVIIISMLGLTLFSSGPVLASDKWQGTDDLVSKKMQEVSGVKARKPLIDLSRGNLGLFFFAAGGFSCGTIIGYQWRKVFGEKAGKQDA